MYVIVFYDAVPFHKAPTLLLKQKVSKYRARDSETERGRKGRAISENKRIKYLKRY